ncbi:hypothetical protein [Fructobacillus ficulneus]|uniref:Uncharacterized protein n=1 Tax=Fructobacillus ficulneus TaxID=157463 RepID=A0A0K8MK79_9LACO|nr:hypothetical protein [Fructobacillus ficulneus]GAP00290.1 hypothetical protein FFIC_283040 [Fructobacillus ficulneus]
MKQKLSDNKKWLLAIFLVTFLVKETISLPHIIRVVLFIIQVVLLVVMIYAEQGQKRSRKKYNDYQH